VDFYTQVSDYFYKTEDAVVDEATMNKFSSYLSKRKNHLSYKLLRNSFINVHQRVDQAKKREGIVGASEIAKQIYNAGSKPNLYSSSNPNSISENEPSVSHKRQASSTPRSSSPSPSNNNNNEKNKEKFDTKEQPGTRSRTIRDRSEGFQNVVPVIKSVRPSIIKMEEMKNRHKNEHIHNNHGHQRKMTLDEDDDDDAAGGNVTVSKRLSHVEKELASTRMYLYLLAVLFIALLYNYLKLKLFSVKK